MNSTLVINFLIVFAVMLTVILEHNSLALLGLTFLLPVPDNGAPRFLMASGMDGHDADESKPIGFTADIH